MKNERRRFHWVWMALLLGAAVAVSPGGAEPGVRVESLQGGAEALVLDNGRVAWQVWLTGPYRGAGFRLPGPAARTPMLIGGRTSRLPAGVYSTLSEVKSKWPDHCFWLGSERLKQSHEVLRDNGSVFQVRVRYELKWHKAEALYTAYAGDNKVFATITWTPTSDEAAAWSWKRYNPAGFKCLMADNLLFRSADDAVEAVFAEADKRIWRYKGIPGKPSSWRGQYNCSLKAPQARAVRYVAQRDLVGRNVVAVVMDVAEQSKSLGWFFGMPKEGLPSLRCGVLPSGVRKGESYSMHLLFVHVEGETFQPVEDAWKACHVNGTLRGEMKENDAGVYVWTNPEGAANVRVCAAFQPVAPGRVVDVTAATGGAVCGWWREGPSLFVLADVETRLHLNPVRKQ